MPGTSPIDAVFNFYNSLPSDLFPGGNRPTIWLNEAPQTDSDASQLRPPYNVVEDSGRAREVQSDNGGPEGGEFTLSIFDFDLGDVGTTALAIRFAGQPPESRAGLDGGTFTLNAPFDPVSLTLVSERVYYVGWGVKPNKDIGRVHAADLVFRLVVAVRAAG
jgi:hypothetical protein